MAETIAERDARDRMWAEHCDRTQAQGEMYQVAWRARCRTDPGGYLLEFAATHPGHTRLELVRCVSPPLTSEAATAVVVAAIRSGRLIPDGRAEDRAPRWITPSHRARTLTWLTLRWSPCASKQPEIHLLRSARYRGEHEVRATTCCKESAVVVVPDEAWGTVPDPGQVTCSGCRRKRKTGVTMADLEEREPYMVQLLGGTK